MTVRIAHISDTHFGTEVPQVVGALIQAIGQMAPDVIVLSGDITQRARRGQFKAATEFMESLPAKTKLVIPGNHDIPLFNVWARFLSPYKNYLEAFPARECVWHTEEVGFVCYDATSPLRHKMGKLQRSKVLKKIAELKSTLPEGAIIIACAHQPLATAWEEDTSETLIRREETARLWSEHGVDIALSGHVHVPVITTTHMTFPELPRHFILAGAGTAVSHRVRVGAPNSFNVIDVTGAAQTRAVDIAQYDLDAGSSQFRKVKNMRFQRAQSDWQVF